MSLSVIKKKNIHSILIKPILILAFIFSFSFIKVYSQTVSRVYGKVSVRYKGTKKYIKSSYSLRRGETLSVEKGSAAELKMWKGIHYYVYENTRVTGNRYKNGMPYISMAYGRILWEKGRLKNKEEIFSYTNRIKLYTDQYPFKGGHPAILYALSREKLYSIKSIVGNDYPMARFFDTKETFGPYRLYRAVIGFDCAWRAKKIRITLRFYPDKDTMMKYKIDVPFTNDIVKKKKKAKQIKNVNKKMKTVIEKKTESRKERYRLHSKIYKTFSDTNYIKSVFTLPAKGYISSPFGLRRRYTSSVARYHRGLDIANNEGTPIRAANAGVVRLSEKLYVRGGCIILDHGGGVYSSYFHMSKFDVKKGDYVSKGQVIGRMGQTGFATGNHVHWEMRMGNVCVSPKVFTNMDFSFKPSSVKEIK